MRKSRIFSLLLCMALLVSSFAFPLTANAAIIEGGHKAKIELVTMKEDGGGYTEMSQEEISNLSVGDKFYIGIKATDFDQIENMEGSGTTTHLTTLGFGVTFDNRYVIAEPDALGDDYDPGVMKDLITPRMANGILPTSGTGRYGGGALGVRNPDNNASDTNKSTYKFDLAVAIASQQGLYDGTTDGYLAFMEFEIKERPANGGNVFSWSTFNGDYRMTIGKTNTGGSYQHGTSESDTRNIFNVIDFKDTASLGLFPKDKEVLAGTTTITGTAKYNEELTATFTGANGDWGAKTATIQWQRADAADGTYADITGAIGTTYKLARADVGKFIRAKATHDDYKEFVASDATAAVEKIALTAPTADKITNVPSVTLNATNKTVSGTYTFTDTEGIVNNDVVTIAYDATYNDVSTVGEKNDVRVILKGTLGGAAKDAYSFTPGAAITGVKGTVSDKPNFPGTVSISGNAVYGSKLTGNATGAPNAGTLSWKWQRNGTDIPGATKSEYTLTKDDVGQSITVVFSSTNYKDGTSAAKIVAKKTLTAPASVGTLSTTVGNATVTDNYTFVAANGLIGTDKVTTGYMATFKNAAAEGTSDVDVTLSDTLAGDDAAYYIFAGAQFTQKGTVLGKAIKTIDSIDWDDTEYTYGDALNLKSLKANVTYDDNKTGTLTYDELLAYGVTFEKEGTAVADGDKVDVPNWNGKAITVSHGDSSKDTNALTVEKAEVILKFDASTLTQKVGSSTLPTVNADPEVKDKTAKIEIKEDTTTTGGAVWKELTAEEMAKLAVGSYEVRATIEEGANTLAVTVDGAGMAKDKLTIETKKTGGGGSSTRTYTVRFAAGEHGTIDGKTSVSVEKDAKLKSSDVPTVKADEGYKFIGWSLDGKTVVDPTKEAVTGSLSYTALYQQYNAHKTYMSGYSDGTFRPDGRTTRAEVASLMAGLIEGFDKDAAYNSTLNDIEDAAWYAQAVKFMSQKGLISGYDDGSYRPNNQITRQEFCAIIAKYMGLNGEGTANFNDVAEAWGKGYIGQLAAKGIVNGYPDGSFQPDKAITRAEVVTILNKVFDRTPDAELVDENIGNYTVRLSDVSKNHWAYTQILEAAIEHETADFHK